MTNPCCRDCIHCHELWWWKDYPKDKQYGHCCTLFKDCGEDVVMQLYSSLDDIGCESFVSKDKANHSTNIVSVKTNMYDEEEIYEDCTVQVLTNSVTGEQSIGWWKNENPPTTFTDSDLDEEFM